VSTAEVSETLSRHPDVTEVIVYGVDLPGHDGKAGVAAIYIEPEKRQQFDHQSFLQCVPRLLAPTPKYEFVSLASPLTALRQSCSISTPQIRGSLISSASTGKRTHA